MNIFKLGDSIVCFPREYEDRSKIKKITQINDGEEALIEVTPINNVIEINAKRLKIYKLLATDETGKIEILWYNQAYLKTILKRGNKYKFYGKINVKNGEYQMLSPVFDAKGVNNNTGKIIPIYPLTYGLSQFTIRKVIENALLEINQNGILPEVLPEYIIEKYNLLDRNTAINMIHFPNDFKDFENARYRLSFEELLLMQIKLLSLKIQYQINEGIEFDKNIKIDNITKELPFKLTNAQIKVLREIESDMESSKNMNRLVQGDVGSRKNSCCNDGSL